MFARFFAGDPVKIMHDRLADYCPDAGTWKEISAYLVRGRRPAQEQAQAALGAYLELREHLGALAAFKAGAALEHGELAAPCREHFTGERAEDDTARCELRHWARFCLAADHLLAQAVEAASLEGKPRKTRTAEVESLFARVRASYLEPMLAEEKNGGTSRPSAANGAVFRAA